MVFPRIQPNPECREGFYNGTVAGPNTELAILVTSIIAICSSDATEYLFISQMMF